MTDYTYQALIEDRFDIVSQSGPECSVFCHNPDHNNVNTPAMSINAETGAFYCYSCEYKGYLNNEQGEAVDTRLGRLRRRLRAMREDEGDSGTRTVDESVLLRFNMDSSYWTGRGLNDETVARFQLGFDSMSNAATIPNRSQSGDLLGVTRRFLDEDVHGKYRHPKDFKKANHLFGGWLVPGTDGLLVVCEGQVDAMKAWQAGFAAVAIYGAKPSEEQLSLIRSYYVRKVVIATDNPYHDSAGKDAILRFKPLSRTVPTYKANWKFSHPKDLGGMSEDNIRELIETSKGRVC